MQKAISLLGSTGSIGRQTLEVAGSLGFQVRALTANKDIHLLEEQTRRFRPAIAAVFDDGAARDFKGRVRDLSVCVVGGPEGLIEAATVDGADTVVTAVVGTAGLLPTLAAIDSGRRIALANKETLVCAGELIMKRANERGAEIIPVDSEHSALFQCLEPRIRGLIKSPHGGDCELSASERGNRAAELRDGGSQGIKKLILTASGGPFRGMTRAELQNVTPEMAMRHPNWKMGRKVTIDSATMMNKGLEVIEAAHLFSVSPSIVEVVVHPESIIHSMVEFTDNSVMAQMASPDMRLPIQYALTYPERMPSLAAGLNLVQSGALTFEKPDTDAFPCLKLAYETAMISGTACAVLNAANEAAVEFFLRGETGFYGIYEAVRAALDEIGNITAPSLEDIIAADAAARRFVRTKCT